MRPETCPAGLPTAAYWGHPQQMPRMEPPVHAYVQRADNSIVQVMLLNERARASLQALGFRGAGPGLQREVHDDADKARLFAALRALGIAFSAGREWCPADVFGWLRERGLLEGPFLRIAWQAPAQFQVTRDG